MGSIVAEIADKIASDGGGERSEFEIRGGTGAEGGGILTLSTSELTVVDGDKLGRIDFRARAETGADALLVSASIWAEADDVFDATGNETEIVFAVGTAGTAVAAEVVRIDHDGQLGIGVATPASLLHVAGTVQVGVDDTGHDVVFYGDAAGAFAMWDTSADSLLVRGATADHATDSAGRLVLQTAQVAVADNDILGRVDFQAPLETQGSDGALVTASIYAEAEETFTATVNGTALVFAVGDGAVAAEVARFDHDGQFGIGVAPNAQLTVEGTIKLKEQSAAIADTAAYGQLWVDDAAKSPLYFTNDDGDDIQITTAAGLSTPTTSVIWRMINSDTKGHQDPLGGGGSDWELSDDVENEFYLGAADQVTESSGIFAFGSTGYWKVQLVATIGNGTDTVINTTMQMSASNNGSGGTYTIIGHPVWATDDQPTGLYLTIGGEVLLKITDVSNDFFKTVQGNDPDTFTVGANDKNSTYHVFTKLSNL
jgi:hypothetical protein